ncbi:MAG: hypothetical protein ACREVM_01220 [Burkholderiales bacterium]
MNTAACFHFITATSRLTVTYGLRWDFSPVLSLPGTQAVNQVVNLPALAFQPPGTPLYEANYKHFAPRLGVAYRLSKSKNWGTTLRAGVGLFYSLVNSQTAGVTDFPPFIRNRTLIPTITGPLPFPTDPAFPLSATSGASSPPFDTFMAVDPHLTMPPSLSMERRHGE